MPDPLHASSGQAELKKMGLVDRRRSWTIWQTRKY